jgi:hypothetical protein
MGAEAFHLLLERAGRLGERGITGTDDLSERGPRYCRMIGLGMGDRNGSAEESRGY